MIRKWIRATRMGMLAALVSFGLGSAPVYALAAPTTSIFAAPSVSTSKKQACAGAGVGASCSGGSSINRVIKAAIQILSVIVGVAAVIMVIISGFRYVTSGGDPQKVSGAKSALIYAIVGLIIAALAQVIVQYVLQEAK